MEIRQRPIGFSECDTPDEVCGFLNVFLGYFRKIDKRLSMLEHPASVVPERAKAEPEKKKGGKK